MGWQQNVAEHGPPWKEDWRLKYDADILAGPINPRSPKESLPLACWLQACQDLQQCGFTAAGGTNDGQEFPVADRERNVLKCHDRVVASSVTLRKSFHGDHFAPGVHCRKDLVDARIQNPRSSQRSPHCEAFSYQAANQPRKQSGQKMGYLRRLFCGAGIGCRGPGRSRDNIKVSPRKDGYI